jgi:peptide/nickel transport system ATP-binding protein
MADVLTIRDLRVYLKVDAGIVKAVDGVSFRIPQGSTVAHVGESGSGKSVIAQTIMGILPKIARIESGEILFADPRTPGSIVDISRLDPNSAEMRDIRGASISIIFQEPMTALSPVHTIGNQIEEALVLHRNMEPAERHEAVIDLLRLVGFGNPPKAANTYPFELSGGLRQRALIAMALACHPALLIADEPTTALDVTIQAQILQLIQRLQVQLNMSVLIITHDLGIVANMAEEVVVLYRGRVMEAGRVDAIFSAPRHAYLKALLRAVPRFDMAPGERLTPIREIKVEGGHLMRVREAVADATPRDAPLLSVRHLTKRFGSRKSTAFGD